MTPGSRVELCWHLQGVDRWLPGTFLGLARDAEERGFAHEVTTCDGRDRLSVRTDCGRYASDAHPDCVREIESEPLSACCNQPFIEGSETYLEGKQIGGTCKGCKDVVGLVEPLADEEVFA